VLCARQGRGDKVGVSGLCLGLDRKRPKGWRNTSARGAQRTKEGQEAGKQGPMPPAHQHVNDRVSLTSSSARIPGIGNAKSVSRIRRNA
jgi:hypothetical protein